MSEIAFRYATLADLPAIVAMLADDEFGRAHELEAKELPPEYARAFAAMTAAEGNRILLALEEGQVVGSLQLVFVPGLALRGTTRAIIEEVRVVSGRRGHGLGTALVRHAIAEARRAGCGLVQVMSDVRRRRAHLFYRRLGFEQSHIGFTMELKA